MTTTKKQPKRKTTARERALVRVVRFHLRISGLCDCVPDEDTGSHNPYCMARQFRAALRVR